MGWWSEKRVRAWVAFLLLDLAAAIRPAAATNGFNLIGFGAESRGMGGADLAVARDTAALNTNPAGLAQLDASLLEVTSLTVIAVSFRHQDQLGNDELTDRKFAFAGNAGWARPLKSCAAVIGAGFFVQGGAGSEFNDLLTPYGNTDELSSTFGLIKLSGGAAFRLGDRLALGGSVALTRGVLEQEILPHTSHLDPIEPSASFFGYSLSEMDDVETGVKVGLQYLVSERVRLGAAWTSRIDLSLEGDDLVLDLSDAGLGPVRYRDVHVEGLGFPQEFGLGVAWNPKRDLLLSFEVNWIDWSGSLDTSTLTALEPDNPSAPARLELDAPLAWKDQYVVAAGASFALGENGTLRAGWNYGRNPIPPATLNPVVAAISEHHLTLGYGAGFSERWRFDLNVEWALPNEVTFDNQALPFGPGARESIEQVSLDMTLGVKW